MRKVIESKIIYNAIVYVLFFLNLQNQTYRSVICYLKKLLINNLYKLKYIINLVYFIKYTFKKQCMLDVIKLI